MRDELFDRSYQEGRVALHEGIDRLLSRIGAFLKTTTEAQHRLFWSAPWKTKRRRRSGIA